MKAIIAVKALQEAVKQAGQVAGGRSSMPILAGVRIVANGHGLEMEGTDLETWGHTIAGGLVEHDDGPNEVIVNGANLAQVAKLLPAGEVLLSVANHAVLIIGGASLPTMPLEDYPNLTPAGNGVELLTLTGKQYKGLAKRLKTAALNAAQTTRLNLTGANIAYGEGRPTFSTLEKIDGEWVYTGTKVTPDGEVCTYD